MHHLSTVLLNVPFYLMEHLKLPGSERAMVALADLTVSFQSEATPDDFAD